jgi:hypothetical protein
LKTDEDVKKSFARLQLVFDDFKTIHSFYWLISGYYDFFLQLTFRDNFKSHVKLFFRLINKILYSDNYQIQEDGYHFSP